MQYSREDAEMQSQHNNNAGGLFTEYKNGTWNEKEDKSVDFKEICQLLNLPLVPSGRLDKFNPEAVAYIFLSQLSFLPLKALHSDLKSMWCDH